MTTETQMCDVCGKPAEFEGGTIHEDGSITEEHLCGDCWVAQQEQERDNLSESTQTERKETEMTDYKHTNEAQERIKMMMVESKAALEDLERSRMSYLIIRCLRSCKNLAADHFNADYFKRTAAKRIEVVVKHGARTPSLRGHEIDHTAIAHVVDTLLNDLDAYADLDVYTVMNMYLDACTETKTNMTETERKEKEMEKTKANDTLHVSIAITGNGGCGKSYITDELEDFFKSAGFDVSVHDDVPTNVDINDVLNGDTHQIVIANQGC